MDFRVKVENVPVYAKEHDFIVARVVHGKAWFFGSYDSEARAESIADEIDGVVLDNRED